MPPVYGRDQGQALIQEGTLYIGSYPNPETIGNGIVGNPSSAFVADGDAGFFKQGSFKKTIQRTLVEMLSGTPAQLVRKDIIRKDDIWEVDFYQQNIDLWALLFQDYVLKGYNAGGWIGDIAFEGTQEDNCNKPLIGLLLVTQLQNCKEVLFGQYNANISTETVDTVLGTQYTVTHGKFQARPHPNFGQSFNEQKQSLGFASIRQN